MRLPEKVILGSLALVGVALVGMTATVDPAAQDYPRRRALVSGDSPVAVSDHAAPALVARPGPTPEQLRMARQVIVALSQAQPMAAQSVPPHAVSPRDQAIYDRLGLTQEQQDDVNRLMAQARENVGSIEKMFAIREEVRRVLGDKYQAWEGELRGVVSRLRSPGGGTD